MSKIAVISDIHSNPAALTRVLQDAKANGCTSTICLGDVVGYGPDPTACIRILEDAGLREELNLDILLMGNHDAALCDRLPLSWFSETAAAGIMRQQSVISDKDRDMLCSLPYTYKKDYEGGITGFYAHGSFIPQESFFGDSKEMFPYMLGFELPMQNVSVMRKIGRKNNVLFVGHTHQRRLMRITGKFSNCGDFVRRMVEVENIDDVKTPFSVNKGDAIVNVGSVGYPRVEPFTSYVIFDTLAKTIEFRKLRFHFREYVKSMQDKKAPVPGWMIQWYNKSEDKYVDEE